MWEHPGKDKRCKSQQVREGFMEKATSDLGLEGFNIHLTGKSPKRNDCE